LSTFPPSTRNQWLSGSGAEAARTSALRQRTSTPGCSRSRWAPTQLTAHRPLPETNSTVRAVQNLAHDLEDSSFKDIHPSL
jgi:hypothetical protein